VAGPKSTPQRLARRKVRRRGVSRHQVSGGLVAAHAEMYRVPIARPGAWKSRLQPSDGRGREPAQSLLSIVPVHRCHNRDRAPARCGPRHRGRNSDSRPYHPRFWSHSPIGKLGLNSSEWLQLWQPFFIGLTNSCYRSINQNLVTRSCWLMHKIIPRPDCSQYIVVSSAIRNGAE
jgi:hypothetical protein